MLGRSKKKIELLINQQFRDLGNFMGDLLLLLELQTATSIKAPNILQIRNLIDRYSEKEDYVLNQHRLGLINDIDELMLSLLLDLEKITTIKLAYT